MLSKIKSLFKVNERDVFVGVVGESGVGRSFHENKTTVTFSLIAYVKNSGKLEEREAVVHKTSLDPDYKIEGIEPMTIVKLKGNQVLYHGQNRINLISIIKIGIRHAKLDKLVQERVKPIQHLSVVFGEFTLNRESEWFEGEIVWLDKRIGLYLSTGIDKVKSLEKEALKLYENQSEWNVILKRKVAEDLLSLKNETWLEDGEKPLTSLEFETKIELELIIIYEDEEVEFCFSDKNLLGGHSISISGKLNGELGDAGIQG